MNKTLFIQQIKAKNLDLKSAEVEGVLHIIKNVKNFISLQDLIIKTGLPSSTITSLIKSIPYIKDINKISFNKEGKKIVNKYNLKKYDWNILKLKDKDLENKIKIIREKYKLNFNDSKREFDQFFATYKTTIKKAKILEKVGLINNKSIVLIGDDDLVSIALALKYKNIAKLTVLEIDENIINIIKKVCNDYNIDIEVKKYDARNEIPANLTNRYDVVLIDPPYTRTGVELFVDRAISLLKPHHNFEGNYIFLNYGNSFKSPQKILEIQNIINNYNLVIENMLYKFNKYHGAESIGSNSSLYILKTTNQTQSKNYKIKNIYTYEVIEGKNFPYVEQYTFKLLKVPVKFFRKNTLESTIKSFTKKHSLKVIDTKVTTFKKSNSSIAGETYTYILANSNLLVHTWPEFNAIHIDLVTCAPVKDSNLLLDSLSTYFQTNYIDFNRVE